MMDTNSKIVSGSLELMMKYGIKSVSMDDIATHLGISKKTIYQHVENKKALVKAMVTYTIHQDQQDIDKITDGAKDAIDEMVTIARHILMFLREMSPSLVYDMQKYYADLWRLVEAHHHTYIHGVIRRNVIRGITEGYYIDSLDADVIAKLYGGMSQLMTNEDVFPLQQYTKSGLYQHLILYHLRSIVTTRGRAIIDQTSF